MMKTFLIFVLIIGAALGFGYYCGWLRLSAEREQGKVAVGMQVDTDKIKADAKATGEKARHLTDKFRGDGEEAEHAETVQGTVTSIDEAERRLLVSTAGNKELTIQVDATTKIRFRETQATLKEMRTGDAVTVVFHVKDGKNLAQSITLERSR
jgi:hypothetical protein